MKRLVIFCTCLLLIPAFSHAAARSIELVTEPEYPKPNQALVVRAHLKQGTPSATLFTWSVDGKQVSAGTGIDSVITTAPAAGKTQTVSVTTENGSYSETVHTIIRPGSVILSWNALTLTPPLYRGRALPTPKSSVILSATPRIVDNEGGLVPSRSVNYTWYVNNVPDIAASGKGKQSYVYTFGLLARPVTISVIAGSPDGTVTASDSTPITTTKPRLVLYEKRPLEGLLLNKAVAGTYAFTENELDLRAYPVFASDVSRIKPKWTIDGAPFEITGEPWLAVFKKTGSGAGSKNVSVTTSHPTDFLSTMSTNLLLQF